MECSLPKPTGIYWDKLSPQKLAPRRNKKTPAGGGGEHLQEKNAYQVLGFSFFFWGGLKSTEQQKEAFSKAQT